MLGAVDCDPAVLGSAEMASAVSAAGMKYQHYAPGTRVQLVLGERGHPEGMARRPFWALREFDRKGAQTVYAHCPAPRGVGLAVYNRLLRAAAFDVKKL